MHRRTFLEPYVFRPIAFILLAVTAWVVVTPEPNAYSVDKTFIKSHSHAPDSIMLALTADDKEDLDEDGSINIQVSPALSNCLTSLNSFMRYSNAQVKPFAKMNSSQAYLFHRQLLI